MIAQTSIAAAPCAGCVHWRRLYFPADVGRVKAIPGRACLYILDTGHRRGDPVATCNKKSVIMGGVTA